MSGFALGLFAVAATAAETARFPAVERLAGAGAQLLIISNSSKRASVTMAKLGPLGFDPNWFVGAITSGELTHKYLLE
jgi:ribonucleotide monophosphatase NagD (HAD superfamily)